MSRSAPSLPVRIDITNTFHGQFVCAEETDRILICDDDGFFYEPSSWIAELGMPACAMIERWLITPPAKASNVWMVVDTFIEQCTVGRDCLTCDYRHGRIAPNALGNQCVSLPVMPTV